MPPMRRRPTSKPRPGWRRTKRTSTTSSRARTKSSVVPSSHGRSSLRTNSSKRSGVRRRRDVLGPPAAFFLAGFLAYSTTPAVPLFHDITAEAGVTFQHHFAPDKRYIVESMSGGVALLDFDNDGLIDMYFVDSLTVETAKRPSAA